GAAGHPLATEDAAGGGGATDRAGLAVVAVLAVRGADAGEAVALHHTRGALALGGADDVHRRAGLEGVGPQLLAHAVVVGLGRTDLGDEPARGAACLLEVALERLGDATRVD